MTETATLTRPALGARVRVTPESYRPTTDPWTGTVFGDYRPSAWRGSVFVVPDEERQDVTLTLRGARRENASSSDVTFTPEGEREDARGRWVDVSNVETLPEERTPLTWEQVRDMPVGTRLLVARPDEEPVPATIDIVNVGRHSRASFDDGRSWYLSPANDWTAYRLDEATPAPTTTDEDVQAMRDRITSLEAQVSDRDSQISEARDVLSQIGAGLLETADRSEWCDEYDRKLSRLYDSLPSRYGFDVVFNEAASRDTERRFIVAVSGHVHVTATDADDAMEQVRDNYAALIREAYENDCLTIDDVDEEDD